MSTHKYYIKNLIVSLWNALNCNFVKMCAWIGFDDCNFLCNYCPFTQFAVVWPNYYCYYYLCLLHVFIKVQLVACVSPFKKIFCFVFCFVVEWLVCCSLLEFGMIMKCLLWIGNVHQIIIKKNQNVNLLFIAVQYWFYILFAIHCYYMQLCVFD